VAREARRKAHAPYSRFLVGAALEAEDGQVFIGCNVENASYGLTVCAERVAVFKAVAEGRTRFRRIAVVADTPTATPPCAACCQVLWDFGALEIILANLQSILGRFRLKDLLPFPFEPHLLGRNEPEA